MNEIEKLAHKLKLGYTNKTIAPQLAKQWIKTLVMKTF